MQFNAQQQAAQLDLSYLLAESSANTFCKATIMLAAKGIAIHQCPRDTAFPNITYFTGASCLCVGDKPRQCKQTRLMVEMCALHTQFECERWIEVDIQIHRLIYEASGNLFLTSFANLFSSVYQSDFRAIIGNELIKLRHNQTIVSAILADGSADNQATCQVLLKEKYLRHPLLNMMEKDQREQYNHDQIRAQYGRTTVDRRNGVLYAGTGRYHPQYRAASNRS